MLTAAPTADSMLPGATTLEPVATVLVARSRISLQDRRMLTKVIFQYLKDRGTY